MDGAQQYHYDNIIIIVARQLVSQTKYFVLVLFSRVNSKVIEIKQTSPFIIRHVSIHEPTPPPKKKSKNDRLYQTHRAVIGSFTVVYKPVDEFILVTTTLKIFGKKFVKRKS